MKLLLPVLLCLFLFSCKEEIKLPDNIVIARWDLRDKSDSAFASQTFTFPELILFRNNRMYVYRSTSTKPTIDYDSKSFEFGECEGTIPPRLVAQIKYINANNLDTGYLHKDGQWDYTHYGLVDLKNNKYCLYIPWNFSDTTFKAMYQFARYAGTAKINTITDTTELHVIRETINNITGRRSSETTKTD